VKTAARYNAKGNSKRAKVFGFALCTALFALSFPAEAQQAAKAAKIGQIRARPGVSSGGQSEVIRRMFRELGYVEGKTIVFEYRYSEGKLDRIPALTDELVRLKVDVLLTSSTAETLAAKNATKTIPIVFVSGVDPVAAGLVHSLARPGGNITGFTSITPVLAGKRLELLKETVPKLSRVAVLWDPEDASAAQQWKESQLLARELGLQLHSVEISSAAKLDIAFKEAIKAASTALAVTQSSAVNRNQQRIADLAKNNRLPAIGARGDFVDSGGLMSYAADRVEPYRRIAWMVDKILKGAKPADIPVEQPTKFELVINLKTAKQIGLTIPPNVLARADKVIK
jgi:putative ABC transport system substrate-binding protein